MAASFAVALCGLQTWRSRTAALRTPESAAPSRSEIGAPGGPAGGEQRSVLGFVDEAPATDAVFNSSLVLLAVPEREPPYGTDWQLRGDDGVVVASFSVADDAPIAVPAGRWQLSACDSRWTVVGSSVQLEPGQQAVKWVGRRGVIEVLVAGRDGAPVASAEVCWLAGGESGVSLWASEPDAVAITDAAGRARIEIAGAPLGVLSTIAVGFLPDRRRVFGAEELLQVTLDSASPAGHAVSLVDARSGTTLTDGRIAIPPHTAVRCDPSNGQLSVPDRIDEDRAVVVGAPSYVSARGSVGELRSASKVALFPSARVRVELLDADGRPAMATSAWVELADAAAATSFAPLLPGALQQPGSVLELELPTSVPLRIVALDREARFGELVHEFLLDGERVTLRLGSHRPLSVACVDEHGAELPDARIEVDYDVDGSRRQEFAGARVDVPAPNRAIRMQVSAAGFVPARFHPRQGAARDGALRVVLSRAERLLLHCVDPEGRGVAGLELRARGAPDLDALRSNPELNGGCPTEHPGWSRHPGPANPVTTRGDGRCVLSGLSVGVYQVEARLGALLTQGDAGLSPTFRREFSLPCDREVEWVVERPIRARVLARDAATGEPLPALRVACVGADFGLRSQVLTAASPWQGWLSASARTLEVWADGFQPVRVAIPRDGRPSFDLDVALSRGGSLELRVTGPLHELGAQRITYRLFRDTTQGFETQISAGSLELTAEGRSLLSLPDQDDLILQLEPIVQLGRTWRFEPARLPARAGAALEFALVGSPGGR